MGSSELSVQEFPEAPTIIDDQLDGSARAEHRVSHGVAISMIASGNSSALGPCAGK